MNLKVWEHENRWDKGTQDDSTLYMTRWIPFTLQAGLAVLAVGSNTTLLLRLLWWCARYAPHSMVHSSLDPVTAACTREPDGVVWVQGGSLLLARGGVCVLGEFSKFKKDVRRKVCRGEVLVVVMEPCSFLVLDYVFFVFFFHMTKVKYRTHK